MNASFRIPSNGSNGMGACLVQVYFSISKRWVKGPRCWGRVPIIWMCVYLDVEEVFRIQMVLVRGRRAKTVILLFFLRVFFHILVNNVALNKPHKQITALKTDS